MSMRRAVRMLRLPLAGLVVACAFTCSAGAARSAIVAPGSSAVVAVGCALAAPAGELAR